MPVFPSTEWPRERGLRQPTWVAIVPARQTHGSRRTSNKSLLGAYKHRPRSLSPSCRSPQELHGVHANVRPASVRERVARRKDVVGLDPASAHEKQARRRPGGVGAHRRTMAVPGSGQACAGSHCETFHRHRPRGKQQKCPAATQHGGEGDMPSCSTWRSCP